MAAKEHALYGKRFGTDGDPDRTSKRVRSTRTTARVVL